MMKVFCANKPNWQDLGKRVERRVSQGRERFEKTRPVTTKRFNNDLRTIAADELEFSKSIIRHIIPVELKFDKNATGIKKLIPIDFNIIDVEDNQSSTQPNQTSYAYAENATESSVAEVYDGEVSDAYLVDDVLT
jgi:hypothetical protein